MDNLDKKKKSVYNKTRNESHRQCVLPILVKYTPHSSAKLNVVYFYICSSVHIMYIIHNKATVMVIKVMNPIIRKSKNSTISDHLLALDSNRGLEVTLTSAYISFL